MSDNPTDGSRRDLLKGAALAGAGLAFGLTPNAAAAQPTHGEPDELPDQASAAATMAGVPFERRDTVRVAIVGTGLRGRSMLHELLGVGNVRITALCDTVPSKVEMAVQQMQKAGHDYQPARFTQGERDYERLVQQGDIDLVYTATPWQYHVPVMLAAMNADKHAATEVPAAYTLEECWKLVDTSERTRRHCIMMENCNYGYNELLVLNMVRSGAFGDLKHAGAAYNHDLREILFENKDEGLWRRAHEPKDSPKWKETYLTGDLNISLIKTARGRTIRLEHDVSSPRPYSRINSVQGTKGIFEDYPARVYLEGQAGGERWTTLDAHKAKFEHSLWRELGEKARSGGHGGMDFVMAYRLMQCMREGLAPDMDVYDAAAWSAPGPLSEMSVARGSAPMKFPDFMRGKWSEGRVSM